MIKYLNALGAGTRRLQPLLVWLTTAIFALLLGFLVLAPPRYDAITLLWGVLLLLLLSGQALASLSPLAYPPLSAKDSYWLRQKKRLQRALVWLVALLLLLDIAVVIKLAREMMRQWPQ